MFGLLGGIASGKSAVARLLAGQDGRVISADELAHEVLESPEVVSRIRERFGTEVLDARGRVDRDALGKRVFSPAGGPEARAALESWIHPPVRARILALVNEARAAGVPRIVLDVPLLLENDVDHGLARLCDALIFVEADEATRDLRARRERGWPEGEVARREATQLSLAEKRRLSRHVIPNNQSPKDLEQAVAALLERLERD